MSINQRLGEMKPQAKEALEASAASAGVLAVERLVELSNAIQAVLAIGVSVLTFAWWVRIWWRAFKGGTALKLPNGDE